MLVHTDRVIFRSKAPLRSPTFASSNTFAAARHLQSRRKLMCGLSPLSQGPHVCLGCVAAVQTPTRSNARKRSGKGDCDKRADRAGIRAAAGGGEGKAKIKLRQEQQKRKGNNAAVELFIRCDFGCCQCSHIIQHAVSATIQPGRRLQIAVVVVTAI